MKQTLYILLFFVLVSCSGSVVADKELEQIPEIFPDYVDVTIPTNIAPLNFVLVEKPEDARSFFSVENESFEVKASKGSFVIPVSKWKKLLRAAEGKQVEVKVLYKSGKDWVAYAPFYIHVAKETIDPYIAYRLIEPGYELWNRMGIYQRNLENYSESAIMENKMSGGNCMNCHSFYERNPEKMLFHMRGTYPCTILMNEGKIEKLNTKTEQTISSLVYPSWHPGGRYIAFSVNDTKQAFHVNDKNRVEVYDDASDVVVYDTHKHEIVTTPLLFSKEMFETFPTFSPDGQTLYFCSAKPYPMPEQFTEIKYSLCAISFDPENRSFGSKVDTLYQAQTEGKSVSFPRVSPDGKYLLYTLSGYGNFSIWHKDADLYMVNLKTKEHFPLTAANSDDVESYHSWSSNGRWVVFSSRRIDGLYTRPYIVYIDENGQSAKPFLLPQKDVEFYHRFMKSYNIPEFITGKVKNQGAKIGKKAKTEEGINLKFGGIR